MSTTFEKTPTQRYVDFDEYIDLQIQRTREGVRTTDMLTATMTFAAVVVGWLLAFVIADHWLIAGGFGETMRIAMLSLIGIGGLVWLGWKVGLPYLRRVNRLFAARLIEQTQPELQSTLLNLVDLREAGHEIPDDVRTALEKRAAVAMTQTDVDTAVDRRPLMRICYVLCALVVLFLVYTLLSPKRVSSSVWRALLPTADIVAPTKTVIEQVDPGDTEVVPGTRLPVTVRISGEKPEHALLRYTTADRAFVDEAVKLLPEPNATGQYRGEILGVNGEGIQQSLTYHVTAGDAHSRDYTVDVHLPPTAEVTELLFTYPQYMQRESRSQTTAAIDDYEGAMVTFFVTANMPLKSAVVTFSDDAGTKFGAEHVPLTPVDTDRKKFRGQWTLTIPDDGIYPRYYHLDVRNAQDEKDLSPARHTVRIHPDRRPELRVLRPREPELERPKNAVLPLAVTARDDFRVQQLRLWKQRNDEAAVPHHDLFKGLKPEVLAQYDWRLDDSWSLQVGDRVTWWVEAIDNNTQRPGRTNSEKRVVVITEEVPPEEVQRQLADDRQQDPEELDSDKNPPQDKPQERPQSQELSDKDPPPPEPQDNTEQSPAQDPNQNPSEQQPSESQPNEQQQPSDAQNGGEGEQQPAQTDGSDDGKALKSLHRHYQDQPSQDTPENNQPQDGQPPPDDGGTGEKPQDAPGEDESRRPQDGNTPPKSPRDNQDSQGNRNNNGTNGEQQPSAEKMPTENGTNRTERPETGPDNGDPSRSPDATSPEGPNGQPSTDMPPKKPDGTDSESQPMPSGDSEPNGAEQTAKPEKTAGENDRGPNGEPAGNDSKTENQTDTKTDTKTGPNESGENADGPMRTENKPSGRGSEEPSDGNRPQEKAAEPGTSDNGRPEPNQSQPMNPDGQSREKTAGEPGDNSRSEPGDPAEKGMQPDKSDPQDPGMRRPSADPMTPQDERPGTSNPRNGKPAPENGTPDKARSENQDDLPPDAEPVDRKPSNRPGQPDQGEDDLVGKGRKDGQQSDQPQGGEAGESKQESQGTPGSRDQGPGDNTDRPGNKQPSERPTGGQPSDETGDGSSTRPSERTGTPPKGTETRDERPPGSEKRPGGTGSEDEGRDPNRPSETKQTPQPSNGKAGGPGPNNADGDAIPPSSAAAEEAEAANLEYGRKAADLALQRLANDLKRGQVDEDWLREMGWTERDAAEFLQRMQQRQQQSADENSPQAAAQRRQLQEWLKHLGPNDSRTERRSGSRVRNRAESQLIEAPAPDAPPELRDLVEAYKRSLTERRERLP